MRRQPARSFFLHHPGGGATATLYDMSLSTSAQFTNIELLVVVGIFLVLMIVLGSILLPVFAIISIAMSITWAFAALPWCSAHGLAYDLVDHTSHPVRHAHGIGMDYNVFILTRIRRRSIRARRSNRRS